MLEKYREWAIEMLHQIRSERVMRRIYHFIQRIFAKEPD